MKFAWLKEASATMAFTLALAASVAFVSPVTPLELLALAMLAVGAFAVDEHSRRLLAVLPPLWMIAVATLAAPWNEIASGAVSLVAVAVWIFRERRLAQAPAFSFIALFCLAIRLQPLDQATLLREGLIITGALLLFLALLRERRVMPLELATVMLVTLVASSATTRSSLFLLAAAAAVGAMRRRSLPLTVVAALIAVACSRSALLVLLIPLLRFLPERQRDSMALPAAFSGGVIPMSFGVVAFPFLGRIRSLAPGLLFSIAILAVGGALLRPYAALLCALTALLLLVAHGDRESGADTAVLLLAFSSLLFLPWSGAIAGGFPIPSSAAAAALVALTLLLAVTSSGIASIVSLALVVSSLLILPSPVIVRADESLDRAIGRGESLMVPVEPPSRSVWIAMSLGNCSALGREIPVASVDALTDQGSAWRRRVTTSEIADWGSFREETRFATRSVLPRWPAGGISGVGRHSFLRGTGAVRLDLPAVVRQVRVTALDSLPIDGRVIVERVSGVAP